MFRYGIFYNTTLGDRPYVVITQYRTIWWITTSTRGYATKETAIEEWQRSVANEITRRGEHDVTKKDQIKDWAP